MTGPLVRADCKVVETSLHAAEGDPAYIARAVFEVLEVLPSTQEVVLAGTRSDLAAGDEPASILRSVNNGFTWTVQRQLDVNQQRVMVLFESEEDGVFAGTQAPVGDFGEIYRSQDQGISWTKVHEDGSERYVSAIEQAVNGDLVAGTETDGHFLRSQDGGNTWVQVDATPAGDNITGMVRASNGDLIAGISPGGYASIEIWRSQDNGASWAWVQDLGYPSRVECMIKLLNGTLLLGISHFEARIYQSQDDGATWSHLSTLPNAQTYCYALAQDAGGVVYAGSYPDCMAWWSDNYGQTWHGTDLNDSGDCFSIWALACLSNGDVLAAQNRTTVGAAPVYKSSNQGQSWAPWSEIEADYSLGAYHMIVLREQVATWESDE